MDDEFKAQLARAYADWQAELFRFLRGRLGCEAEAAAEWFVRKAAGALTREDQARLQAWLAENPAHAEALRRIGHTWAELDRVPRPQDVPLSRPAGPRRWSRRLPAFAVAAMAIFAAVGLGALHLARHVPLHPASLETAPREQREVRLPDGSRLTLDAGTRLTVSYWARW